MRTKIVATLGPACWASETIGRMAEAGADVFRINMSHTSEADARDLVRRTRSAAPGTAVLIDVKGPKIRTTGVEAPFMLPAGARLALRDGGAPTTPKAIGIAVDGFVERLRPGAAVFLDDGLVRLEVEHVAEGEATVRVVRGGQIRSHRGVNVPGLRIASALTEADRAALRMAAEEGVDFVAVSFVQCADDLDTAREALGVAGQDIHVVAKVETRAAVDALDDIVERSDAVMVARGDLGVEIPAEEVPLVQKRLIRRANEAARPVIVATQMLETMVDHPVPTRAETSDVANAILDGADALMLSGETARGRYPVEAVATMDRIARSVETHADLFRSEIWAYPAASTADFVAHAVARAARDLGLDAIVALTQSGRTARLVSRFRPGVPILASTPSERTARQLALVHAVQSVVVERPAPEHLQTVIEATLKRLLEAGALEHDSRIAVTGGVPLTRPGSTNLLVVARTVELLDGLRDAMGTAA